MNRFCLVTTVGLASWGCSSGSPAEMYDAAAPADTGPADSGAGDAETEGGPSQAAVAVPLTGCTLGSFLAEVDIGGSQSFELSIDTGSTTLAVAAKGCTSCGVSPLYAPGQDAVDEHVTASSMYGDGTDAGASGWSAEVYEDHVSAGGSATGSVAMRLAAIQSQSDFFYSFGCGATNEPFQGILGLAPAADALPNTDGYFDELVAQQHFADVFATELCDPGGTLWLGGYDPTRVTASPQYTPFSATMNAEYAYVVSMESVEIAGVSLSIPTSSYTDTILDTGNSAFFLPPAVFSAVANAITSGAGFAAAFGAAVGGPDAGATFFSENTSCATTSMTKAELDSALPPITFVFGSSPSVSVQATATESYLISAGGNTWCPVLLPLAPAPDYPFVASLGAPALRSSVVIFDRANRRIGFAPHAPCP